MNQRKLQFVNEVINWRENIFYPIIPLPSIFVPPQRLLDKLNKNQFSASYSNLS